MTYEEENAPPRYTPAQIRRAIKLFKFSRRRGWKGRGRKPKKETIAIKVEKEKKIKLPTKRRKWFPSPQRINFYRKVFKLYQGKGTLDAVGKKLHLTRERIRQILVSGTQLGLFSYKSKRSPK